MCVRVHECSSNNLRLLLPECGETPDRLSLYELITPLAFLSPHPPSQALPRGNTCITELCSSVQGALLDNFLLTSPPNPSSAVHLPSFSCCFISLSVLWMKWRHHCRRESGAPVTCRRTSFSEEQPSLRRRSVQCCKDLARRKANVGED